MIIAFRMVTSPITSCFIDLPTICSNSSIHVVQRASVLKTDSASVKKTMKFNTQAYIHVVLQVMFPKMLIES